MFNSTFFLSIFSQKRSRREGLGCWMCPCGSGPLGAGCREGNVTVSRDGTGFSHVFTTSTQLLSAIYSQHLSAILSAIPPTSTYLRSCRLLLWSWKVWRPKKQAKRQVQTKVHGCFSRRLNMSKSRDLPPQYMDDKSKTQELSEKLQPLRQRLRLESGFRRQWAFVHH